MASWTCELSGEPLNTATDEIVVTPSGHVCLKKLLLTKLSENGGMDPFGNGAAPLSEQDVIVLHYKNKIIPPRPSVTSMPALLGLVGKEYEALVLELFDTRKALEETRKELSHALYQNDAAVRVVARLAQERDGARQELMTYKANIPQEEETDKEPPTKRAKTTSPSSFVEQKRNGIPPQDLESMTETWQSLAKERKDKKKSLEVVPPETLKELVELDKKNWHKTRNKAGIVDMKFSEKEIVTAGRDKQLIVYSLTSQTLVHTITIGVVATCVDVHASRVVAGLPDGTIAQYVDGAAVGSPLSVGANAVDIALHPTGKHVVAIVENGTVAFCGITDSGLNSIYTFQATPETEYASGALHPDGLICAAGTTTGAVHLWDFKNQTLADTYESDETKDSSIVALAFSNSGYHLAVATESVVQVHDIRKSKLLFSKTAKDISCIAFDVTGKYLAYGSSSNGVQWGVSGVHVVTTKEGNDVCRVGDDTAVNNIVWTCPSEIVTSGSDDRQVRFYGIQDEKE